MLWRSGEHIERSLVPEVPITRMSACCTPLFCCTLANSQRKRSVPLLYSRRDGSVDACIDIASCLCLERCGASNRSVRKRLIPCSVGNHPATYQIHQTNHYYPLSTRLESDHQTKGVVRVQVNREFDMYGEVTTQIVDKQPYKTPEFGW